MQLMALLSMLDPEAAKALSDSLDRLSVDIKFRRKARAWFARGGK
jgi:hypothetical protein